MSGNMDVDIRRYDFDSTVFSAILDNHYAKSAWPIVYLLSDNTARKVYVGETADALSRLGSHLRNKEKKKLTTVHLVTNGTFNKSATLDIESNLVKYISGDGNYQLVNANIGLSNHNYYQKEQVYWELFRQIWDRLRAEGICKHSISYISNANLFKYSPYKSLYPQQVQGLMLIIQSLLNNNYRHVIVNGGAGSGKSILAVFLFKLMNTDTEDFNFKEMGDAEPEFIELITKLKEKYPDPEMALVVPVTSFRETLKKVFKNVKGLKPGMVVGPSEITNKKFDIILVDEAHRLRRRVNITNYGAFDAVCEKLDLDKNTCSELDWVLAQSERAILFYDVRQSVRPSDVRAVDFIKLGAKQKTQTLLLDSQFRLKGGKEYEAYVGKLLSCSFQPSDKIYTSPEYDFTLFSSFEAFTRAVRKRDGETGLARMIAGYSWPWQSKKNKKKNDIEIDGISLQWNRVLLDWINSANAVNEVGCIHTIQGYDLNYAGVIFGHEISYDKEKNEMVVLKENYFDAAGKKGISDPAELKEYIINIYNALLTRGREATYVYVCDPNLREYFSRHIMPGDVKKAPRLLSREEADSIDQVVPVYDLAVAAGSFGKQQKAGGGESYVELPSGYKPSADLFACRVTGESMNKIIPNGSLCLFRKYNGGSRNGRIVLVELTDLQDEDSGSVYTIKEFSSTKNTTETSWRHATITLKPLSHDPSYREMELKKEAASQLKVIGLFERVL